MAGVSGASLRCVLSAGFGRLFSTEAWGQAQLHEACVLAWSCDLRTGQGAVPRVCLLPAQLLQHLPAKDPTHPLTPAPPGPPTPAVYEDFKMSVPSWHLLLPLGATLSELAAALGAAAYQDHYARDLGTRSPPAPTAGAAQQRGGVGCGVRGRALEGRGGQQAARRHSRRRAVTTCLSPCRIPAALQSAATQAQELHLPGLAWQVWQGRRCRPTCSRHCTLCCGATAMAALCRRWRSTGPRRCSAPSTCSPATPSWRTRWRPRLPPAHRIRIRCALAWPQRHACACSCRACGCIC